MSTDLRGYRYLPISDITAFMSVKEQLRAFRYIAGTRDIPWAHLRSVNVAAHHTVAPDLQLMKNLISLVAECDVSTAVVANTSETDMHQLLSLLQLSLQFVLWSQSVMKGELLEKRTCDAAKRISSNSMGRLEEKLEASRREQSRLREERDALKVTCRTLESRALQAESKVRCLEKELRDERTLFQENVSLLAAAQHKEGGMKAGRRADNGFSSPPAHQRQREGADRNGLQRGHNFGKMLKQTRTEVLLDAPNDQLRRHSQSCSGLSVSNTTSCCAERESLLCLQGEERRVRLSKTPSLRHTPRKSEEPAQPEVVLAVGAIEKLRAEVEAAQRQITMSCEAVHSFLSNAMKSNVDETKAIVQGVGQWMNNLCDSVSKEKEQELQEVKTFLAKWKEEAQQMLDSQMVTVTERLNKEFMIKQQQLRQQQCSSSSSVAPLGSSAATNGKECSCRHCNQRFPPSSLSDHEAECDHRFVNCEKCGRPVMVRLLPKHKCASRDNSESDIHEISSQIQPSSMMLLETQKELRLLLEEDQEEGSTISSAVL